MEKEDAQAGSAGRGIQSIEIGGRLLRVLADAVRPMMLRDLADATGMPPGQAHAYLVSFRKMELVEQDGATGRYRLGSFALRLGLARLRGSSVYEAVAEAVPGLAEKLDLAVSVCVWGTHGPTVVRIQEASHHIHANVRPGTVFALTSTATGRLFSTYMPEKMIAPLLEAELKSAAGKGRQTGVAAALAQLRAEFETIRQTGVATTRDRPVPGISALCAPIFDHTNQIQAAIMVMGPTPVVDCDPAGEQARTLLAVTRGVCERLGYDPKRAPEADDGALSTVPAQTPAAEPVPAEIAAGRRRRRTAAK